MFLLLFSVVRVLCVCFCVLVVSCVCVVVLVLAVFMFSCLVSFRCVVFRCEFMCVVRFGLVL